MILVLLHLAQPSDFGHFILTDLSTMLELNVTLVYLFACLLIRSCTRPFTRSYGFFSLVAVAIAAATAAAAAN